ncbi:hypothetical protein RND81_06G036800 [Saponaria officinalis]|uniref:Uncharacterized protein n=1 Tax=Saponaria officinalis TaxID=3572 RepID=A0AAW1K416_SAPOF
MHISPINAYFCKRNKLRRCATGVFRQPQKRYDNYYNTMRRDHPGFQYGNPQEGLQPQGQQFASQQAPPQPFGQQFGQPRPRFIPRPQAPSGFPAQGQSSTPSMSTEDMIRALTSNVATMQANQMQFQRDTEASIQTLETQMGQMSSAIGRLEAHDSNKLPSQTILNPKPNASAITLRSGKELPDPHARIREFAEQEEEEAVVEPTITTPLVEVEKETPPEPTPIYKDTPPFTEALKRKSCPAQDKDVSEQVSAMFQRKLPPKCNDPGMFTVPCTVGSTTFLDAMLDLGASINVLPYSLYQSLKLGPLQKTGVVIQLADRSNAYPKGVVEDGLVMVDKLIFPADFYVLDMEHDSHAAPILLGRPFLKTASTKIDVSTGSLTMESDGQVVKFNIYDSMKYPRDDHSCFSISVLEPLV